MSRDLALCSIQPSDPREDQAQVIEIDDQSSPKKMMKVESNDEDCSEKNDEGVVEEKKKVESMKLGRNTKTEFEESTFPLMAKLGKWTHNRTVITKLLAISKSEDEDEEENGDDEDAAAAALVMMKKADSKKSSPSKTESDKRKLDPTGVFSWNPSKY